MKLAMDKCRKIVREHGLERCIVPHAEVIEVLGQGYLWIEERLEGVYHSSLARERSESEFARIDSDPEIALKWREIFMQAALLICKTGYWDVSWRNLLLMERGVGLVDFEDISSDTIDTNEVSIGIIGLLEIAPKQYIVDIFNIAIEEGMESAMQRQLSIEGESIDTLLKKRSLELDRNSYVRKFLEDRKINRESLLDEDKYPFGSREKVVVQMYNYKLKAKLKQKKEDISLLEHRFFHWQPFSEEETIWPEGFLSKDLKTWESGRGLVSDPKSSENIGMIFKFEEALNNLQRDGLIAVWNRREAGQVICYSYDICA